MNSANNMIISHKYKFIFIHIPKSGGSSVSRSIIEYYRTTEKAECELSVFKSDDWDPEWGKPLPHSPKILKDLPQHAKYPEIKKYFSEKFPQKNIDDYFKFSFVRNPWARLVSVYEYDKKLEEIGNENRFSPAFKSSTFKDFIKNNPEGYNQLAWLCEKQTFAGKIEHGQKNLDTIYDKLKIPRQKLPRINTTNHKRYTEYYDDETREIVAEKHAKDIEHFGYKFGD